MCTYRRIIPLDCATRPLPKLNFPIFRLCIIQHPTPLTPNTSTTAGRQHSGRDSLDGFIVLYEFQLYVPPPLLLHAFRTIDLSISARCVQMTSSGGNNPPRCTSANENGRPEVSSKRACLLRVSRKRREHNSQQLEGMRSEVRFFAFTSIRAD